MTELRRKMELEMTLNGYAESTKRGYITQVRLFSAYYNIAPDKLGVQEVKQYLNYLIKDKKLSKSYINTAYSALKFFYEKVACTEWELNKIPRVKQNKSLPVILSRSEVIRVLNCTNNLKHKTILTTVYSAGLRVSEVVALKVSDIDPERMQIRVHQSKGNKDRYTILSEKNLKLIQKYRSEYPVNEWLFPGRLQSQALGIRSVQKVFERAAYKAGMTKKVSVHSLRHSFATHLLENGTNIYYIQKLLGHTDIKTTTIYLRVTRLNLENVKSPFDEIGDSND